MDAHKQMALLPLNMYAPKGGGGDVKSAIEYNMQKGGGGEGPDSM